MKSRLTTARIKAAAIHTALSAFIAVIISALIFRLWFPGPIAEITDGTSLFWLIIAIDIICGPLLLMVIWNSKKPRRELLTDTSIVVAIQLAALGYGVWTIYQIRPVYIVFETDRLRMINQTEIDPIDLAKAPERWKKLPSLGPKLLSTREPKDGREMLHSIELSLSGREPSVRPEMWEEYAPSNGKIRAASRPLAELLAAYPEKQPEISRFAQKFDVPYASIIWLPFTSVRSMEWIALIDARNMEPFTYIPGDGFFPRK